MQLSVLVGILEIPASTPYYPLLLETGWWTMRGRLAYKKLMLYQNIITSDDKRVVKNIIKEQKEMKRPTTWYSSIQQEIYKYGIELKAEESLKSSWKKHVKTKIGERMEKDIREECSKLRKTRLLMNNKYEKKHYLSNMDLNYVKKVLRTRLHMSKLPGNYKGGGEGTCLLCNLEKGSTEHYFDCPRVRQLVEVWDVQEKDLESLELDKMKAVANFIENVEMMMEPMKIVMDNQEKQNLRRERTLNSRLKLFCKTGIFV